MIISHAHRFIFFAVPRTATHAMRQALRAHLAATDWEQQMLHGQRRIPIPELAALGHGHISLRQAQAHLPAEIWRDYLKFAMVRNPYDRFISACFFLNRRNPAFAGREVAFMKQALRSERFRRRVLVQPQYRLLADEAGRIGMDHVGRYETLQASFDTICRRIGIEQTRLPEANRSGHDRYGDYYDGELRELVAAFYERDFEELGYDRHDPACGPAA